MSSYTSTYAIRNIAEGNFTSSNDNFSITINYNKSSSSSEGWLDYITLNAERQLRMSDDQLLFRYYNTEAISQIVEFEMEYYKTLQKERANFDPETSDRDAMRARMVELRDERDGKYKDVLTEKQYVNYTKMAEERREQMRQRRGESQEQGRTEQDR